MRNNSETLNNDLVIPTKLNTRSPIWIGPVKLTNQSKYFHGKRMLTTSSIHSELNSWTLTSNKCNEHHNSLSKQVSSIIGYMMNIKYTRLRLKVKKFSRLYLSSRWQDLQVNYILVEDAAFVLQPK